jgi:hypothetical protein
MLHIGRPGQNFEDMEYQDSTTTNISDIVPETGKRFRFQYEYDFGDSCNHEVLFEGMLRSESNVKYPVCLEGERACGGWPRSTWPGWSGCGRIRPHGRGPSPATGQPPRLQTGPPRARRTGGTPGLSRAPPIRDILLTPRANGSRPSGPDGLAPTAGPAGR